MSPEPIAIPLDNLQPTPEQLDRATREYAEHTTLADVRWNRRVDALIGAEMLADAIAEGYSTQIASIVGMLVADARAGRARQAELEAAARPAGERVAT